MRGNRHFYEAEDILSEFQQEPRSQVSIRIDYPARYFSTLPKENLCESDFAKLLSEVRIPRYVPPAKVIKPIRGPWERASWPAKPMAGNYAWIRDIHAQLCSGMNR